MAIKYKSGYIHNFVKGNAMFGLGMTEIVLILVIALVVVGPKKLPEVAKGLGKGFAEFKKTMNDFKDAVNIDDIDDSEKSKKSNSAKPGVSEIYKNKWQQDIMEAEEEAVNAEHPKSQEETTGELQSEPSSTDQSENGKLNG